MLDTGSSLYFLNIKNVSQEDYCFEKYNVTLSYLVFFVPKTGRLDFRKYGVESFLCLVSLVD